VNKLGTLVEKKNHSKKKRLKNKGWKKN